MSDARILDLGRRFRESRDLTSARAYHRALVRSGQPLKTSPEGGAPLLRLLDGAQRDDAEAVAQALDDLGEEAAGHLLAWLLELEPAELAWLFLVHVLDEPRIADAERVRLHDRVCETLNARGDEARQLRGVLRAEETVARYYQRGIFWAEGAPSEVSLTALTVLHPELSAVLDSEVLLAQAWPVILRTLRVVFQDPSAGRSQEAPPFELHDPRWRALAEQDPNVKLWDLPGLQDAFVLERALSYATRHPSLLSGEDAELAEAVSYVFRRRPQYPDVVYHLVDKLTALLPQLPADLAWWVLELADASDHSGRDRACAELVGVLPQLTGKLYVFAERVFWELVNAGAAADELGPQIHDGLQSGEFASPLLATHHVRILHAYARTNQPTPMGRVAQLFAGGSNPYHDLDEAYAMVCGSPYELVQDVLAGTDWDYASAEWA